MRWNVGLGALMLDVCMPWAEPQYIKKHAFPLMSLAAKFQRNYGEKSSNICIISVPTYNMHSICSVVPNKSFFLQRYA